MEIYQDFKELLALLNDRQVEYLVVGSYALAHHGSPRYTGDIDLYVNPIQENAVRLMKALEEFGFGGAGFSADDFSKPDRIAQLGVPPVRIDIMTSITGVRWEDAWRDRETGRFGDIEVQFIGKAQFIQNKKATGRAKDAADIEAISGNSGTE